jgi:hypothetical protein
MKGNDPYSRRPSRGWMTSLADAAKQMRIDRKSRPLPTNVHKQRRDMTSQQLGVSPNQPRRDGGCEHIWEPRLTPTTSSVSYR